MNKRLEELRQRQLNTPIEDYLEEIRETAGWIKSDGYDVSNIVEAVDKFNGDVGELKYAYSYYYAGLKIKDEYVPIQGYLSCIGNCIVIMCKKLNQ